MRITTPNHTRLRIVALACWAVASWLVVKVGQFNTLTQDAWMFIAMVVAATLLFAVGVAFWSLGTDMRAGVVFDAKGLMFNLGHSAAFVSWENIADVGVCRYRSNLFDLGSKQQVGIKLHNPQAYLQSYESRLPASPGVMATALRLLQRALRPLNQTATMPGPADLARTRARTGYDVLIPETLLGKKAAAFVEMVSAYRAGKPKRDLSGVNGSSV